MRGGENLPFFYSEHLPQKTGGKNPPAGARKISPLKAGPGPAPGATNSSVF